MKAFVVLAGVLMAFAVALAAAPTASAKGCVRIEAASRAGVGGRVRVTVRTYMSRMEDGKVVPAAPAQLGIPRFKVIAEGPDGRRFRFEARRVGDGTVRVAWVAFPARGVWRLKAENWLHAPRSCAPAETVRVR